MIAHSTKGMALTGPTRTGYCMNDDSGLLHICIDLTSSSTGRYFCDVADHTEMCSSFMRCDTKNWDGDANNVTDGDAGHVLEDGEVEFCPVQHWCVSQREFASYVENADGCDNIQDFMCESINYQAVKAYYRKQNQEKYVHTLNCLLERCPGMVLPQGEITLGRFTLSRAGMVSLVVIVFATIVAVAVFVGRRYGLLRRSSDRNVPLIQADKQGVELT